jgi:AcrR family transcriptional regulator
MQVAQRAMAVNGSPARSPGRPRDAALDTALLAAAVRHLGEFGYAGMSMGRVAAAAGTTAPSLRRRFRGKLQLAVAGIDAMAIEPLPRVTGRPRADALAVLENLRANLATRDGMALLGTILAEHRRHPELLDHFRRRLEEPCRERLRQALARGVEAGQLPDGLDLDAAVTLLIGSLYARCLRTRRIPDGWAQRTLTVVWPRDRAGSDELPTARSLPRPTAGGSGIKTTLMPLPHTRSMRRPCSSPKSAQSRDFRHSTCQAASRRSTRRQAYPGPVPQPGTALCAHQRSTWSQAPAPSGVATQMPLARKRYSVLYSKNPHTLEPPYGIEP